MITKQKRTITRKINEPCTIRDKLYFEVTNEGQYNALMRSLERDHFIVHSSHWDTGSVFGYVHAIKTIQFGQAWKASKYVLRPDEVL